MINGHDFYTVITAMVPLYVAMMLGYASVRWWGVFSAVQCSGINRFVAVFAVPLLSFTFIANNNPYKMDGRFILADTASKVVVFILLAGWAKFAKSGNLDWMITLFSVATLPNTLVMGIPLLRAMYGDYYGNLMVQVVVLQSIIWYTLLLFLFEFRAAKLLLLEQFPETAASIVSFKVDPDVMSLDGREPLQTQAQIGDDGKIRVFIRRSVSVSQHYELFASPRRSSMTEFYPPAALQSPAAARRSSVMNLDLYGANSSPARASDFYYTGGVVSPRRSNVMNLDLYGAGSPPRRSSSAAAFGHHTSHLHHQHSLDLYSMGLTSMPSSKAITPRPSNLTGAEIYSLASQTATPTTNTLGFTSTFTEGSSHHGLHHHPPGHLHNQLSRLSSASSSFPPPPPPPATAAAAPAVASPRTSNFNAAELATISRQSSLCPTPRASNFQASHADGIVSSAPANGGDGSAVPRKDKDMQLVSADGQSPRAQAEMLNNKLNAIPTADGKGMAQYEIPAQSTPPPINVGEDFSFGSRTRLVGSPSKKQNGGTGGTINEQAENGGSAGGAGGDASGAKAFGGGFKDGRPMMPSTGVMVKLILQMVGRKLLRNPNTYASLIGVIWSLIAFRFGIEMPKIISESLRILAQAGLGMAMFSLGLFMALQPKLIACGTSLAVFAMAVRFLTGPAVMAASSITVGLRGVHLHAAIVQAALPQGIVPFVFSREYDLHPDILSTAVIFGMLVALPTTLLYYVLLGI